MIQLVVRFQREFKVTYTGETFQSPSTKIIEPVNEILKAFPDARIKPPSGGTTNDGRGLEGFYYMLYLDDLRRAEDLRDKLDSQPAVETAFIKKSAEAP